MGITSNPGKHTYGGKEYMEDLGFNLYYYGARFKDPVTGRFMTPDPIQGPLNPYSYVGNNPIDKIDPTGMLWNPPMTYSESQPYLNMGLSDFSWVNQAFNEMNAAEEELNEWAETKIREKLKKAIEADGAITIDEAVAWYIWGNGEPLKAEMAYIDFSNVEHSEFPGGVGSSEGICLSPGCVDFSNLSDGLVYGSMSLTLGQDEKGYYVEKTPDPENENKTTDRFNFNQHEAKGNMKEMFFETLRNYGTEKVWLALNVLSYAMNHNWGSSFYINLYNRAYIH